MGAEAVPWPPTSHDWNSTDASSTCHSDAQFDSICTYNAPFAAPTQSFEDQTLTE